MISDALSDAITDIDWYLNNPTYPNTYSGSLRERILKLRNDMGEMLRELDTPPDLDPKVAETPSKE
jgi:hypothetical protein